MKRPASGDPGNCNANFGTGHADGSGARMQTYQCNNTSPERDGGNGKRTGIGANAPAVIPGRQVLAGREGIWSNSGSGTPLRLSRRA